MRAWIDAADDAAELTIGLNLSGPMSTFVKPAPDGNLPLDGSEGQAP